MRCIDPTTIHRRPVSGGRVHLVGVVLLALLLQALLPLLHARLQVLYAAQTGQRIDVAAFCLPGHPAPPAARATDDVPPAPPTGPAGCPLCQGTGALAGDIPVPPDLVPPAVPRIVSSIAVAAARVRTTISSRSHQPRGPPAV